VALFLEDDNSNRYLGTQEEVLTFRDCGKPLFTEFAKVVVYEKVSAITIRRKRGLLHFRASNIVDSLVLTE
jgi:hypothetical protein